MPGDPVGDPGVLGPAVQDRQRVHRGVDHGHRAAGIASGTARVPLPPPTSTTRGDSTAADQRDQRRVDRIAADRPALFDHRTPPDGRAIGAARLRPTAAADARTDPCAGPIGRSPTAGPAHWSPAARRLTAAYRRAPTIPGMTAPGLYGWPVLVASVLSLKGGVGKTTVTLGLASAAVHRGVDTLLVDLDPQMNATDHGRSGPGRCVERTCRRASLVGRRGAGRPLPQGHRQGDPGVGLGRATCGSCRAASGPRTTTTRIRDPRRCSGWRVRWRRSTRRRNWCWSTARRRSASSPGAH